MYAHVYIHARGSEDVCVCVCVAHPLWITQCARLSPNTLPRRALTQAVPARASTLQPPQTFPSGRPCFPDNVPMACPLFRQCCSRCSTLSCSHLPPAIAGRPPRSHGPPALIQLNRVKVNEVKGTKSLCKHRRDEARRVRRESILHCTKSQGQSLGGDKDRDLGLPGIQRPPPLTDIRRPRFAVNVEG